MTDFFELLTLCAATQRRRKLALELQYLKEQLNEERLQQEWRRLIRVRHYVTLEVLKEPSKSAWAHTWEHGTDTNLINLTSLTRNSFCLMLERFKLQYEILVYNPKGGRPRKLQYHHQVLGLLLCFYVGTIHSFALCVTFGVPPSTLSRVLKAAETALEAALHGFAPARIVWPTLLRQKALAKLVAARQPLLQFTWGFLDGKNYRVMQPSDPDVQNAHYNGWLHNVFVTGTLYFSADGLIVWAKHNCPGSWNDSDTSLDFRRKLIDSNWNPDARYGVVADSAFPCGSNMTGRILTPLKDGDLGRLKRSVRHAAKVMSSAITFIRQSAEWGMGSVENVYHRLLMPLPADISSDWRTIVFVRLVSAKYARYISTRSTITTSSYRICIL